MHMTQDKNLSPNSALQLEIKKERCYAPENPGAYISSIGYAPEYSGT